MNNDLISREALKKAIDTWDKFGCTAQGKLIRLTEENKDLYVPYVKYQDIINCINNAPSVEPCENCDLYFKAMTKEVINNDVR